jgi:class 3 adenylate cyclase
VGVGCASCGTALRESAKFCDECGTPTIASAETPKYKQVTVLFADVVRSMDIAANLDMERLREIMTEVVERSADVARRYGGTVEYNGDGVMALFGAPVALEDHAFRACLAALDIQQEANRLAAEVQHRDGVALRLRVGLDSGRVIAGEIGSGAMGYRATGEHVGMAQRMEAAAPPGAVMLSESTARLVEHIVMLAEPELVHIKGAEQPVRVRRLMAIGRRDAQVGRAEASLVGRRQEMAALDAIVDAAIAGRGGVVNVVGAPGIGKSRVAREAATLAAARGLDVIWVFCESHAGDIHFHVVSQLLRAGTGITDLDGHAARLRIREQFPAGDAEDMALLDDLLGVSDPDVPLPQINPDARRRRLTALINSMTLMRTKPRLFIVEDVHWIDAVSEAMLADFLSVVPRTPTVVLITSRPEYEGALTRVPSAQVIALAPLGDSDTTALLATLLGSHPSVHELATIIGDRAAGNPFFAEEMVRELAQRGVLAGVRGEYACHTYAADIAVPATVEAAIAARIDRLSNSAKKTLNAASVIGARFGTDLLAALGIDAVVDQLLSGELIEQVRSGPHAEYAFRHPLIRAVAYETQLKSARAQCHRRLADAIQESGQESVEENAALIAEHFEAADERHAAYGWHMRAAAWSTNRDIGAARVSWERARRIADALPDNSDQLSMRIGPRTLLCATDWQAIQEGWGRFEELRELCSAAGDKVSLAIGMTGLVAELLYTGNSREGSRLASEQMELLESIGDATLTMGLAIPAFLNWCSVGKLREILRWSQTIIDLADGDPAKGAGFGLGSPLATAVAFRGVARCWLGLSGWRQDFDDAVALARRSDPATLAFVISWTYGMEMPNGVLLADDAALRAIEAAVQIAEGFSNDLAVGLVKMSLGTALLSRDATADRDRGLEVMVQIRQWQRERAPSLAPVSELIVGPEKARRGDRDGAIAMTRKAADELHEAGRFGYCVLANGTLADLLLQRDAEGDLAEAQRVIDRLAQLPDDGTAMRDITLLRVRTLMARARGDDVAYPDLASRYGAMAKSLGYEGHIAWAEAMNEGGPG